MQMNREDIASAIFLLDQDINRIEFYDRLKVIVENMATDIFDIERVQDLEKYF